MRARAYMSACVDARLREVHAPMRGCAGRRPLSRATTASVANHLAGTGSLLVCAFQLVGLGLKSANRVVSHEREKLEPREVLLKYCAGSDFCIEMLWSPAQPRSARYPGRNRKFAD